MISVLIISYGREKEVIETFNCFKDYNGEKIELLFLDNNPTNNLELKLLDIIGHNLSINFRYFYDGFNYGVAEGRNYLIKKAQGDILVTLDDDIEVDNFSDFLAKIKKEITPKNIGVLAFNIKNFYTHKNLRHEIPHGNKSLDFSKNLYTYYFIGAGHAIKKEVYNKAGLYPKDLGLYGGEERDLSFRILENNYDILYVADLVIYHKVSPNGRMPKEKENFFRYRNQLIVLNRYMPFLYRLTSNTIWSIYYVIIKKGSILDILYVLYEIYKLDKKNISYKTISKIKNVNGRLLF